MCCFAVGDKCWSRSCSVRRKSSSRPMLAIGDNVATTAGNEHGRKKRYSTGDGDSSRRSGSSSSGGEKKQIAIADDDETDGDQQQKTSVQGP